ncbi:MULTISPECIES: MerC domain-containing protein [Asticcacaulis]|uniref:MerC domain-containing protein n=1 Tax=Asticcacaulis TaxID=76890 RepID=UPI001AE315F7|nr:MULTISPECIES: MerC domain-containing protein [Asticcacaulis]MBP2160476.1 hypothetical protein [Asticcacaulis solisilvae]MDR6801521.1 hypothetical protein [Asticcacaulis sp. BE141]
MFRPKLPAEIADLIGVALSAACLLHCLALPAIIVLLPSLGIFFDAHWVHQVLIGIAAPVSMWAIIRSGFWRQYQVGVPMVAGLLLLTVAAFFKPAEAFEAPISMIGATLLAFGHYRNSRLVRKLKQLAMTSRLAA